MGIHDDRDAVWRDLCADFDLEDNQDDHTGLHRKRRRSQKKSKDAWRDRRLCGQARQAIQMGLYDCADPALQNLIVLRVEPTPRSACLCVHLLVPTDATPAASATTKPDEHTNLDALLARINAAAPRLRSEVARGINRKKTPQLIFQLHTQEIHDES